MLDEYQISYCLMNYGDGAHPGGGRDIDLVVDANELSRFERCLDRFCVERSGLLVNEIWHAPAAICYVCAWDDEPGSALWLDVHTAIWFGRRRILGAADLLASRERRASSAIGGSEAWVAAAPDRFIYHLLKRIESRRLTEPETVRLTAMWNADPDGSAARVRQLWSVNDAKCIEAAAQCGTWDPVRRRLPRLRRLLHARFPRSAAGLWSEARRVVWRLRMPTGAVVALLGPDGTGKTSVIQLLQRDLDAAFAGTQYHHFKPNLTGIAVAPPAHPAHKPHEQRVGWSLQSLCRLVYYLLDYWVGFPLLIWRSRIRSKLVVFDRYFQDLAIDPIRLRHRGPMRLAGSLARLIPQPDLFIVLDAPGWLVQQRKQEVPAWETTRQSEEYRALIPRLTRGHRVNASASLTSVAADVRRIVLMYLAARTAARRRQLRLLSGMR